MIKKYISTTIITLLLCLGSTLGYSQTSTSVTYNKNNNTVLQSNLNFKAINVTTNANSTNQAMAVVGNVTVNGTMNITDAQVTTLTATEMVNVLTNLYPSSGGTNFIIRFPDYGLITLTNDLTLLFATNRTPGQIKTALLTVDPNGANRIFNWNSLWKTNVNVPPPTTLSNGYLYRILIMGWSDQESNTTMSVVHWQ